MIRCPICDKEITDIDTDYLDGHLLCEEYYSCSDEHHTYDYNWAYGNGQETIGRVTFTSFHSDSIEERSRLGKQFDYVLKLEKERYKESIKAIDK